MRKIKTILSVFSATMLCAASFAGITSNAAGNEKLNTYALYCDVDSGKGVMWADVTFRYNSIDIDDMEVKTGAFGGDVTHSTLERTDNTTIYSASFRAGGTIMAPGILFSSKFWTTNTMTLVEGTKIKTSAFDATRKFIGNNIVNASFVLIGDANNDKVVDMADETAVIQHLGNPDKYGLSKEGYYAADVNFDGVVNNTDLKLIRDYNNGVINWF
ncbi:MAG: dockerin type I repeat-containing protein [Ruminococcus sp.]|nr:dockerin type I repeat-containing protein [Ruminococcus sp.]